MQWQSLPSDSLFHISAFLEPEEVVSASLACRSWSILNNDPSVWKQQCEVHKIAALENADYKAEFSKPLNGFGVRDWEIYLGAKVVGWARPAGFHRINHQPCPFWPGKKIQDTHVWTYIPSRVEIKGKEITLSLNDVQNLVKKPLKGHSARFLRLTSLIAHNFSKPLKGGYWILTTKMIVESTRGQDYEVQKQLVRREGYEAPTREEAVLREFLSYVKFGNFFLEKNPVTYTNTRTVCGGWRCSVGGFSQTSLNVICAFQFDSCGLIGMKKFS